MMLAAILGSRYKGITFPGDIVLCIVSDEENGGTQGAKFLVENHASLFQDIQYAIGEFGGFTLHIKGRRFYPIMVAEKQMCQLRLTISGLGGHGSIPVRGAAMAKLGHILQRLDKHRLPTHVTPVSRAMVEQIADALPLFEKMIFKGLLRPTLTNKLLDLLGEQGKILAPLLQNTVSPTMLQASKSVNIIPGLITLDLDGRLLPGFTPQNVISELRSIIGNNAEINVVQYETGPQEVDMTLFDELTAILKALDREAIPVPLLLSGVTDGRFFSRLGIQTYGFLPMNLPEDFNFSRTIHAADERIPITALEFGTKSMHLLLCRQFIG
jgi:acetylornithine deacetylase/succinyl-diaminopimelate desuccinylase-like protein